MATCPVLLSVGVDYLTVIETRGIMAADLASCASSLFRNEVERGNVSKGWGMAGFSGFQAGQIQIGKRDDEILVRLSSNLAQRSWRQCYLLATNVSRMDLQVTVNWGKDCGPIIRRQHRQALRWSKSSNAGTKVRYISSNDGGQTVYLGSRESMRFGRIYDKGVESGLAQFANAVRYEVEFKGKLAQLVASDMASTHAEMSSTVGKVSRFFYDRGVPLQGLQKAHQHESCHRIRSDHSQSLLWLRESVRPCLRRLIRAGKRAEVFEALGLSDETETD